MKILIVKTSSLGDIIQTFPVASCLRKRFPDAQIDWVVEERFAELVEAHPCVDKTLAWDRSWFGFRPKLRAERYDHLLDLQGNCKSGLLTWWARAENKVGFSREVVPEWPNLLATNKRYKPAQGRNIRQDYLTLVQAHFQDREPFLDHSLTLNLTACQQRELDSLELPENPVLVCPGSAWRNKTLDLDALRAFLKLAEKEFGFTYLFGWGTGEERKQVESLGEHILPRLPLPVLQNVMGRCQLVIAVDSLPLHLCGTTSTPSFSVFGPSSARKYTPTGAQHHSLQGSCPYGKSFEKRCPILRTCRTGACIRSLTGENIFAAFSNWWNQSSHRLALHLPDRRRPPAQV